ncbi:MAG TPA: 4-alpha-glucanotransferase, partial [Chromatiales bacterium]|nr:4-alpha-glucanotransferase [Chromatiales bacterium]
HVQFVFERQWQALRAAAHARGILLFGDLPLFVALDSADVWAHRALFALDAEGRPTRVAGVPPDYFSETGQLWGNPLYEWEAHERERFRWWVERLRTQLARFDLVRIDHFRGLEACWEIPAGARTAMEGRWVPAPGMRLLERLRRAFGGLPLVAEDLGVITPAVEALRERFGLPGMRVLQFAFGGDAANPHLPHNHVPHAVVYTGTHDNDTTVGWHAALEPGARAHLEAYLGGAAGEMPWPLLRMALASVARLAVIPMQDALGLGSEARMNRPGRTEGNWRWRFQWDQVPSDLAARLRGLLGLYGRLA